MARWIRASGTNAWAGQHRGGDDGAGGARFDLSPCPAVAAFPGMLGGTHYEIRVDGAAELPEADLTATLEREPGAAGEKPPYRVPLVAETERLEPNGLTVVSTFSGAGGSCLGFRMAGFRPLLAVEFVPAAVEVYKLNHPGVPVYDGDIRELTALHAMELAGLPGPGVLDVLEGSPPCESFSTAGKLSAGWGQVRDYSDGKRQVMDDLFFEFTRLLGGLKPRAFVAENVSGLVKGVSKGYFKRIHAELAAQGYVVRARMLDAQWLGVPQRRQRVIFVGIREDLALEPGFPDPLPYRYSIRDALKGIGRVVYDNGGTGGASATGRAEEDLDAPARTVTNAHGADGHFQVERDGEVEAVVGGWPRREMSADEPAATVGALGYSAGPPGSPEVVRVRRHGHGFFGGDVTELDEPSPTIQAQQSGSGPWVERGNPGDDTDVERLHHKNRGYFKARGGDYVVDADEPSPTVTASGTGEYEVERGRPLSDSAAARWRRLGPGGSDPDHFNLVRADEDAPSPTIVATDGRMPHAVAHPNDPRKFSIPELRRLCGFPDDFVLTGSYAQQWERLGNSVPPPMMYHVARVLAARLLERP